MGTVIRKFIPLSALFFLASGCWPPVPPLQVHHEGNRVVVDVRTLGEYPTTVRRLRLIDASSSIIVWELRADPESVPQILLLKLQPGENPTFSGDPSFLVGRNKENYNVTVPMEGQTFRIEKNRDYVIEVCGHVEWFCPKERFSFPESVP